MRRSWILATLVVTFLVTMLPITQAAPCQQQYCATDYQTNARYCKNSSLDEWCQVKNQGASCEGGWCTSDPGDPGDPGSGGGSGGGGQSGADDLQWCPDNPLDVIGGPCGNPDDDRCLLCRS